MLKIIQGIPSHSASKTDLYSGIYREHGMEYPVILKLFVDQYQFNHQMYSIGKEYMHELSIYQYLTRELVLNPILQIRNIIPLVTYVEYNYVDLLRKLEQDLSLNRNVIEYNLLKNTFYMLGISSQRHRQKINQERTVIPPLSNIDNYVISNGTLNLLHTHYVGIVTPKMQMCSFADYIAKGHIQSNSDFMEYLFIILMTLYAMANKGINQNDLHWGNIIMDQRYKRQYQLKPYFIVYEKKLIFIHKPYTPYIYDFDRATIQHKYLKMLQGYQKGGNCPTFHAKRDLLKTICCAYHAANTFSRSLALSILDHLVLSPSLRTKIIQTNTSCWLTTLSGTDSILCDSRELVHSIPSWTYCLHWVLSQGGFSVWDTSIFFRSSGLTDEERNSIQSILKIISPKLVKYQISPSQYILHNLQFMKQSLYERNHLLLTWEFLLDQYHQEKLKTKQRSIRQTSYEPMDVQVQSKPTPMLQFRPKPKSKPTSYEPMDIQVQSKPTSNESMDILEFSI